MESYYSLVICSFDVTILLKEVHIKFHLYKKNHVRSEGIQIWMNKSQIYNIYASHYRKIMYDKVW